VAADASVVPLGMPGRGFGVWGQLMHPRGYKEVMGGGGVGNTFPSE